MAPKTVLSIVHYRQPELLRRCLTQIQKLHLSSDWKIIVVDNSPGDHGVSFVQSDFQGIRLLHNGRNNGFGGGHNLAFSSSDSDYFIVLNPDIIVLENSLEILIDHLENNAETAISGPCLLNPDGSMQYSARRFYDWKTVLGRRLPLFDKESIDYRHLMKDKDLSKTQKVDWLLGAAMAIRRKAFAESLLFDSRYTLYFEDVDLCYFIQKKGWNVIYCPNSRMFHDHQRESAGGFNRRVVTHFSSWLKFWLKTIC